MSTRLLVGHCVDTLATLPEKSVQCVVTSPPYYGLRDYGLEPLVWGGDTQHAHEWGEAATRRVTLGATLGGPSSTLTNWAGSHEPAKVYADKVRTTDISQGSVCECGAWCGSLGLEPTPELFLEHLVEVFRAVRRVLRDDGCIWVNMGDSYAGSGKGPTGHNGIGDQGNRQGFTAAPTRVDVGFKAKDLMMMPVRVAMALQADGWYLRSQIPWLKRNSMPESVTDRPASAVEYVFLLSKSARYYWDADAVRTRVGEPTRRNEEFRGVGVYKDHVADKIGNSAARPEGVGRAAPDSLTGRSRRNSDWFFESWQGLELDEDGEPLALIVNPAPYKGSHYATFPPKLVEPMIKAGTSEKGQCPECGAPWARVVEKQRWNEREERDGLARGAIPYAPTTGWTQQRIHNTNGQSSGTEVTTTGWQPTCVHADLTPVPQVVLDPFFGSGTVGMVAERLGRNAIGCELNPEYAQQAVNRVTGEAPMFTEMDVS